MKATENEAGEFYVFNVRPIFFSFGAMALGVYMCQSSLPLKSLATALLLLAGAYVAFCCRNRRYGAITALLLPAFYLFGILLRRIDLNGFVLLSPSFASLPPFSYVREHMVSTLYSSMDDDEAAFAVALLIGDTSGMDGGLLENIRYGGVAHIFAVSGMNVSEIYVVIQAIFKKLRLRREIRDGVSAFLALYYTGICGFSPSVTRAAIMCIMLSLSFYFSSKSDFLECTGASGIIILLLDPSDLYDVGCVLSFVCCFGIAYYYSSFNAFLLRAHVNNDLLREGIAMMFAVNIMTIPLFLDYFSYVSLWGLILNLAFVPILTAEYTLVFLACAAAMIFPFASYIILYVPAFLLSLVIKFFTAVDFTLVSAGGFTFGAAKVPYYTATAVMSEKTNLPLTIKLILTALLAVATAAILVFSVGG